MRLVGLMVVGIALAACSDGSAAKSPEPGAARVTATAIALATDQPGERTFRDWYAVCDNANSCYAFGHGIEATGWVRVSIPAGPQGQPSVIFGLFPEDGSIGGGASVEVDGVAFAAVLKPDNQEDFPVATVAADRARALVAAMTQGQAMTISAGSQDMAISLSGAAASMLWIDERQGRLGTTTALMRQGNRPASSVPQAPAPPVVTPAAAIAQGRYGDQEGQTLPAAVEALPDVVECRAETGFNPDLQAAIVSARLDTDTVLWAVPCGAGAYNYSNAYFTTRPDGTNPRRVTFPSTGQPQDLLVNAGYDPITRIIDAFNKGRGIGDCGTASSWTWTDRGFVLKTSTGMSECNGVPFDYWPTFWVTQ